MEYFDRTLKLDQKYANACRYRIG